MSSGSCLRGVPCGIQPSPRAATRRERGLAVPADPDRRTRVLHRPRPLTDVLEAPVLTGVLGPFVGERGGDRVDGFVRARAALLERNAEHLELAFDVTDADTHDRAAARERVERGEGLGRLQRVLVGGDEHVRHHARARRLRGEEAERGDRIEPLRRHHLRGFAGHRDVVAHRDVEEAGAVARARDVDHVLHGGVLALPRRRRAHRQRLHRQLQPVREHTFRDDRNARHAMARR